MEEIKEVKETCDVEKAFDELLNRLRSVALDYQNQYPKTGSRDGYVDDIAKKAYIAGTMDMLRTAFNFVEEIKSGGWEIRLNEKEKQRKEKLREIELLIESYRTLCNT